MRKTPTTFIGRACKICGGRKRYRAHGGCKACSDARATAHQKYRDYTPDVPRAVAVEDYG